MANLKTVSIVAALVATCLAVKPPGFVEKPAVYDESPPNYSFEYQVKDHDGGEQGHTEHRRGLYAVGGFYTRLPGENGAQRVSYYADDWGFHPVLVAYGGHGYNTRLAFGDKAVATVNAAAGSGGVHAGGPAINAIGVNIPHGVNPLPDLTQTGAAALAAEAPHIPDAANLVASVGQPPAPPQPPKPTFGVGPAGTTFLQPAPQITKQIQPVVQQIGQIKQLPLLQSQQPHRLQLPYPVATAAPLRPIAPAVTFAPIIPRPNYPRVQQFAPVGLGLVGLSGAASTSIVGSPVPARRPTYITQTAAPVIVSTTPRPVTFVGPSVEHSTGGGAIFQGVTGPATSFVSSGPQIVQTITKAPAVVTQFQTVTPATTVISGGVDAFKESSAAAAAAAASALSAAAASGSGGQVTLQQSSLGGQGGEVYYSQRTDGGVGLANSVASGSFLGAAGQAQQELGIIGQTEYSQDGGYQYERPVGGGLTYAPLGAGGFFGKGQVGGVVGQTFQYSPYLTTGYHQGGYVYSPGNQPFYQSGPQFAFGSGASSSSSSSTQSSLSQGSSAFGDGAGLTYYPNNFVSPRPQSTTSFQSQVGQTQFQQTYPSLPPPTTGGYQEVDLGLSTVGFGEQQTIVSTPTPQVTVQEEFNVTPTPQVTVQEEFNVTPTPSRPIVIPEYPKETSTPATFVETSTPAPLETSPTFTPAISSSTIDTSVPSTIEVTTPTPLTSPTPFTPFYSTFPSNAPCIACQSTRSQEITLLTAPAEDTASTLDSELQQIFFPDPTPSLQVDVTEENIVSTPAPVDVTPKPLEQRIGAITTQVPTVSVEVLEGDANRATTLSGFAGSSEAREEVVSTERGSGGQFFSGEAGGNGQFYSGVSGGNGPLFSGGGSIYSGASGSGAQFSAERLSGQQVYSGGSGSGGSIFGGASGGGSEYYSGGASGGQIYSGGSGRGGKLFAGTSGGGSDYYSGGGGASGGQIYSGGSGRGGKFFAGTSGGGSEYYSGGGGASGGQIYTVTSTPAPPVTVSLGVTPSPSVLYVDRPVAVPVPYAVTQLVPYAVKGSSAYTFKDRTGQRLSSSSSSSSSESYESSTPSVISVTQITKIRTSGRKNADRGYVKQVVEESGSSSAEEEEEEEVIVRGGSIKLGSGRYGSGEGYSNQRLPPAPFRSSSLIGTQNVGGNYGERISVGRPRKLCIEYGGFKPPLVPSDHDYSQSIHLR